jgi:hypothetical protein
MPEIANPSATKINIGNINSSILFIELSPLKTEKPSYSETARWRPDHPIDPPGKLIYPQTSYPNFRNLLYHNQEQFQRFLKSTPLKNTSRGLTIKTPSLNRYGKIGEYFLTCIAFIFLTDFYLITSKIL